MLKIALPLLVVGLYLSATFANANYGVNIGDTFTYDVIANKRTITLGTNTATADGYEIDGHAFAAGTSVEIEVLEFDDSFINTTIYEIRSGSYFENDSSSTFGFQLGGLFTIIFPLIISYGYLDESQWNQTEAEELAGLGISPFVEPETATWDLFKEFAAEVQTGTSLVSDPAMQNLTLQAEYTDSVTEFLFEAFMGGHFTDTYSNGTHIFEQDYTIDHHYQFAYNKANGVLKGHRLVGTLSGTTNGTVLEMEYDNHVELLGYNLPKLQFGGGFIPGFEWFIALPAIAFLGLIAVIIRKRK